MVTALLQLNHSPTVIALAPALLLCYLGELLDFGVKWTFAGSVSALVTYRTDGEFAFWTCTDFPTVLGRHVFWLDPFSAAALGTVYSVLAGPFFEFAVPVLLEVVVEEVLDVP